MLPFSSETVGLLILLSTRGDATVAGPVEDVEPEESEPPGRADDDVGVVVVEDEEEAEAEAAPPEPEVEG